MVGHVVILNSQGNHRVCDRLLLFPMISFGDIWKWCRGSSLHPFLHPFGVLQVIFTFKPLCCRRRSTSTGVGEGQLLNSFGRHFEAKSQQQHIATTMESPLCDVFERRFIGYYRRCERNNIHNFNFLSYPNSNRTSRNSIGFYPVVCCSYCCWQDLWTILYSQKTRPTAMMVDAPSSALVDLSVTWGIHALLCFHWASLKCTLARLKHCMTAEQPLSIHMPSIFAHHIRPKSSWKGHSWISYTLKSPPQ